MKAALNSILARWGQTVTLRREGEEDVTLKVFIQPVLERSGGQWTPTPLGLVSGERFLCLAPPEVELDRTDRLIWCGGIFVPRNVQAIRVGDEVSHRWAILERGGEVDGGAGTDS